MNSTPEEDSLMLRIYQLPGEAEGVLWVALEDPAGTPLPAWSPGAHTGVDLPGDVTRQYLLGVSTVTELKKQGPALVRLADE